MKKYRIEFEVRFRAEQWAESEDASCVLTLDETVTLTDGLSLINTAGVDMATDAVVTDDEDYTLEFAEIFNIEWYEIKEAQDAEV